MSVDKAVRIWWDETVQAYRIVTPYKPQFVEFIKQNVPSSDRGWDNGTKTWTITEKFMPAVKGSAEMVFGGIAIVISKAQAQAAQQQSNYKGAPGKSGVPKLGQLIEEWFQLLPYEAARKAYREGALALHPDRGGSLETMSKFNSLWQQIEKLQFNQGK